MKHFGSVELMFRHLDRDESGTLSFPEIRRACRSGSPPAAPPAFVITYRPLDSIAKKKRLSSPHTRRRTGRKVGLTLTHADMSAIFSLMEVSFTPASSCAWIEARLHLTCSGFALVGCELACCQRYGALMVFVMSGQDRRKSKSQQEASTLSQAARLSTRPIERP
eukprot:g8788.t1